MRWLQLAVVVVSLTIGALAHADWQRIDASTPFVDRDGQTRHPGCSGGPVRSADGRMVPADTDFAFFVRPGDPERLVIIWAGGGACFDAATCIGSAMRGRPVYTRTVDDTVDRLARTGGILDHGNPANPLRAYTQVVIPYCTGDVHIGGTETVYTYPSPTGPIEWTIRHRGFDNVVAVLTWLAARYGPSTVLLTGASAGGYGVQFAYPAVRATFPATAQVHLLADSASGIVSTDFHERALGPDGVWAVWKNLAPELTGAVAAAPDQLPVALLQALAMTYPDARLGQYTRAHDGVQVFYFNIMRHPNAPDRWRDPAELLLAAWTWSIRASNAMNGAAALPNVRTYLAAGVEHTIIGDDRFYRERSAAGLALRDWLADMLLEEPGPAWRSVRCTDCLR